MVSYNFMTPIDENTTTYYWLQHYNNDPHDTVIAKQLNDGAVIAFNEDREILEAVHTGMKNTIQVSWLGNHESLLELAEANGLSPEFSCRAGVCNTCECSISSGDVSYLDEPLSMPEDGRALICCSIPDGDITLDL